MVDQSAIFDERRERSFLSFFFFFSFSLSVLFFFFFVQ
jgi:hypothetical protein